MPLNKNPEHHRVYTHKNLYELGLRFFQKKSSVLLWMGLVLLLIGMVSGISWLNFSVIELPSDHFEIIVPEGLSAKQVGYEIARQGVTLNPRWFGLLSRLRGKAHTLKAGSYELMANTSPWGLIDILSRGDIRYRDFKIIEGWTFAQIRKNLDQNPDLIHDSRQLTNAEILEKMGASQTSPEGLFFPDTYLFSKHTSDFSVLKRAYHRQIKELEKIWAMRQTSLPLKTPYEALILASLIEKETGSRDDRGKIASVFVNRLRKGMLLQTDPTVIYGLGAGFDGNLRKHHLSEDTPYNTYTRPGLPPTPIAIPGKAALMAAVWPETTPYLYFVARGNGSSQFSTTLLEHHQAVNRFQKGQ